MEDNLGESALGGAAHRLSLPNSFKGKPTGSQSDPMAGGATGNLELMTYRPLHPASLASSSPRRLSGLRGICRNKRPKGI